MGAQQSVEGGKKQRGDFGDVCESAFQDFFSSTNCCETRILSSVDAGSFEFPGRKTPVPLKATSHGGSPFRFAATSSGPPPLIQEALSLSAAVVLHPHDAPLKASHTVLIASMTDDERKSFVNWLPKENREKVADSIREVHARIISAGDEAKKEAITSLLKPGMDKRSVERFFSPGDDSCDLFLKQIKRVAPVRVISKQGSFSESFSKHIERGVDSAFPQAPVDGTEGLQRSSNSFRRRSMADLESDLAKKSGSKQGSFRRRSVESMASPSSMERKDIKSNR